MKVAVGNDHRGVNLKRRIAKLLSQSGHQVVDVGLDDQERVDYPDIAGQVAHMIAKDEVDRGILVCGTGIGMSIAANKVSGVRATTCHDARTAEICRRHNDVNALCFSADLTDDPAIDDIVQVWLETGFDGGRHSERLEKIRGLECS